VVLYTTVFYSVIKKNEILSFVDKWMELENIILSEVARFRKPKATCFLSYMDYRPTINISNIIYIQVFTEHVPKSGTSRGN
jgi:hypothetical protein